MSLKNVVVLLVCVAIMSVAGCAFFAKPAAEIKTPYLFSSNMVLQQGMAVPFWGKATPGGKVTVVVDKAAKSVVATKEGAWRIDFPAMTVGGPITVQVIGQDTLTFENVMIGEVWVGSGQSNMEMPVAGGGMVKDYAQEIAQADYPNIRLFTVEKAVSAAPRESVAATTWQVCSPQTVPQFSASAYFFGRHLNQNLNVPIGLIHSSWGGTPAESWTSKAGLATLEDFKAIVDSMQSDATSLDEQRKDYEQKLAAWQRLLQSKIDQARGDSPSWELPDLDAKTWKFMNLPVLWEKAGLPAFDGIVWFRKQVNIPKEYIGKDLTLHLGPIDDDDATWFNGVKIGGVVGYNKPRDYQIPAALVKPGVNVIAVQVLDTGGGGGIWGAPNEVKITAPGSKDISLAGAWQYKEAVELQTMPPRPISPDTPYLPASLYNAMINPLIPYAIRGAIWYQGENNAGRAYQYRSLFQTMITDWRANWGQGDFPFIFTQLANYTAVNPQPEESDWAELREAQLMALALPNTGMAVTIDIGDAIDIHPKNKQDVGKRLALNALNKVYGKTEVVPCGPIYKSMTIEENKIRLTFDYVGGGLAAKGDKLLGFAIAGEDKKFVWGDAVIDGETVVVSSPYIANPVAVRYAWASNPICNLYNQADLPATPFRTDDWPGITATAK